MFAGIRCAEEENESELPATERGFDEHDRHDGGDRESEAPRPANSVGHFLQSPRRCSDLADRGPSTYEWPPTQSMRRKSGVPMGPSAPLATRPVHRTSHECPTPSIPCRTKVLVAAYLPLISVRRGTGPRYPLAVPGRSQLAYTDAYARSVEARVDAADGLSVLLDSTVFYPGGGGQPSDIGRLTRVGDGASWAVVGARKADGEIVHDLEPGSPPPGVGDSVRAEIEWSRRHLLMRTHTALHVLCGVVWRDYGAQVTGGNMEPGAGRMDFEFERMSGELVGEIEANVNRELGAEREVRVNVLPRDEAFAIPDLIRTKFNLLPPGIEEVRTIEIVALDLQADGGTHVANTREVGSIRVTGYESKGRINKRIRIELATP